MNKLFYSGPTTATLITDYAKKGRIDEQAAVQARDSIDINASASQVWRVLMRMDEWPKFNLVISDVRLRQGLNVDAPGSMKINGFPIKFTIAVVEPEKELTWVGTSLWTKAIDQLIIEAVSEGKTKLHLNESLAGMFVPWMSSSDRLHQQHMASLQSLKEAAESQSSSLKV